VVSQGIRGVSNLLTEQSPEVEGPRYEISGVFSATRRRQRSNAATVINEPECRLRREGERVIEFRSSCWKLFFREL